MTTEEMIELLEWVNTTQPVTYHTRTRLDKIKTKLLAAEELYKLVGDNYPRNSPIWRALTNYEKAGEG